MDVKEIREALKMSRPQFSEWSGIPVRTLENWESGVRVPPAYVVDLLNVKFREDLKMRNEILRACEAYCDAVRVNLTARIYWNEYFWPLVMTNADKFRTLPVAIAQLKEMEGMANWQVIMAGNAILVLPVIIVYLFASKQIMKSFTYSGIK